MKANVLRAPLTNEVLVVYSCVGGIPYVNLVTRHVAGALEAYSKLVIAHGDEKSPEEIATLRAHDPHLVNEIEEIEGRFYQAHTDRFDAFIEVQQLQ